MKSLIDFSDSRTSVREQCKLLRINRSSLYAPKKGESAENMEMMRLMDAHILKEPTAGVLTMRSMLRDAGLSAGEKKVRRLMRLAGIVPIYPRRHLTVMGEKKYVHPYLLRSLKIERPDRVWAVDITYVPMESGFMYLTAVIDVYSRYIVGWGLSNSLDAESSLRVIREAVAEHGAPEILNSDQGSQFTCKEYVGYLKSEGIRISMDGKGRALDNVWIERFWRTIKYQHIYLNAAENGLELHGGIKEWLVRYHSRDHQGIGMQKPKDLYKGVGEKKKDVEDTRVEDFETCGQST